jgi:hypothetical protein
MGSLSIGETAGTRDLMLDYPVIPSPIIFDILSLLAALRAFDRMMMLRFDRGVLRRGRKMTMTKR